MSTAQKYPRAPITEAIIDLRVEAPDGLTLPNLERCRVGEEETYPRKMNLNLAVGQLQFGAPGAPFSHTGSTEQIGFMFKSADEKQLFQVHREGFTMNRLAPYPGWVPFRDEARRLWNLYRERTRPRKVVRLAVRYINRLDLPGAGVELKDYLNTSPEVSPSLLQPLAGFFMRLTIPQPDIKATVLLTEAAAAPSAPNSISVVLDIDLFRADELPLEEEDMWDAFEDLRRRQNEIFEACITEKTRELIR